ncbi:MAG: efflux RND transporter periplasmic adaptor subunit [Candidatus Marinimicrobia bacterium]|nr:efflux RND transporter periplasmic adaptor subunit [Candidatus Neomarinimicrobiota bacterium]
MNVLLGRDPGAELELEDINVDEIRIPEYDQAKAMLLVRNPEYRTVKLQKEMSRVLLNASKESYLPSISGQYQYSNTLESSVDPVNSVSLTASWTLFSGLSRRENVQQKKLQLQQADIELGNTVRVLEQELRDLYTQFGTYSSMIDINRRRLVSAKRDFEIVDQQYRLGEVTMLERMQAQIAVLSAESSLVEAQYSRKAVESEILKLIDKISGMTMKKKKLIIVAAAIAAFAAILFFALKQDSGKAVAVQMEEIIRRTIVSKVYAAGNVQPVVNVNISANVAGEIKELYVEEGQEVKKGDLLVQLDKVMYEAEVDQARSYYRSCLSAEEVAEKEFRRAEKLYETNNYSESQYDQAKARYEQAVATLEQSSARLEQAKDNLRKTTLVAPIDGTVIGLKKEKGEIAMGSTFQADIIMTVADLSGMEVEVDVNENDIVQVELEDSVDIEIDALEGKVFPGIVTEILAAGDHDRHRHAKRRDQLQGHCQNGRYPQRDPFRHERHGRDPHGPQGRCSGHPHPCGHGPFGRQGLRGDKGKEGKTRTSGSGLCRGGRYGARRAGGTGDQQRGLFRSAERSGHW